MLTESNELQKVIYKNIQSVLNIIKDGMFVVDSFVDLFKKTTNYEEKFKSILDQLESMKKLQESMIEQIKSSARQQVNVFNKSCYQFKIIQNILKSANNNLDQKHLNSLVFACNKISESLKEIENIKNKIDQKIQERQTLLELHSKLADYEIESNSDIQELLSNFKFKELISKIELKKDTSKIGSTAAGTVAGAAVGYCLKGSAIFTKTLPLCLQTGALSIAAPMAITACIFGFAAYGITTYIQSESKKKLENNLKNIIENDKIEKSTKDEIENCIKDKIKKSIKDNVKTRKDEYQEKIKDLRTTLDNLDKLSVKLEDSLKNLKMKDFQDINLILKDEFQRDSFMNPEQISEILNELENMKSNLKEIINFKC